MVGANFCPTLGFRMQDSAIKRPANETIVGEGDIITGTNTNFTQIFKDGDKLRFRGKSEQFKVLWDVIWAVTVMPPRFGRVFFLNSYRCFSLASQ